MNRLEKEFVNHDKHQQTILMKALVQLSKFKLTKDIAKQMVTLLVKTLKLNREMDNQEELYVLYDSMLLIFYDLLEDLKKTLDGDERFDTDY